MTQPTPTLLGTSRHVVFRMAALTVLAAVSWPARRTAGAQTSDVTPPTVQEFAFTPTSIDVSGGSQTVVITARLTDDLSGVSGVQVSFRSPTGVNLFVNLFRVSGTAFDGTWRGNLGIPQFSAAGTWTASVISLFDVAGNNGPVTTAVLASRGLPTDLIVVSNSDNVAPTLVATGVSPSSIDVSTTDQVVTFTLQASDNLSGLDLPSCSVFQPLSSFTVTLRSPSGVQNRFIWGSAFALTSGNRTAGTWQATFPMPRFSETGIWRISFIQLIDCAGNRTNLNEFQLNTGGMQIALNVAATQSDIEPPTLTSLVYSPITLNTSTGNQVVTVQMGVRDNLSGADFSPTTPQASFLEKGLEFKSPSGIQTRGATTFTPWTLISGTPLDGVWQSAITFPQFSEEGTWAIDFLVIKDRARNLRVADTASLRAAGLPFTLEVIKPSLIPDGSVGSGGGSVSDQTFGDRAEVIFPPGAVSGTTQVAIDVLEKPLQIPNPTGFSGPGSLYVNIALNPEPGFPLAPPGLSVTLPLPNPMIAGALLNLYKVDPSTGQLVPEMNVFGLPATGNVNSDGLSATFIGVAGLSTVVGLIPEALNVHVDIKPGDGANAINLKSRGSLPVAILSTSTFDARTIDISFIRIAGAPVRTKPNGQPMFSYQDVNGDGLLDLVVQIDTEQLEITSNDTQANLTARTKNGLSIIGHDSIKLVP